MPIWRLFTNPLYKGGLIKNEVKLGTTNWTPYLRIKHYAYL